MTHGHAAGQKGADPKKKLGHWPKWPFQIWGSQSSCRLPRIGGQVGPPGLNEKTKRCRSWWLASIWWDLDLHRSEGLAWQDWTVYLPKFNDVVIIMHRTIEEQGRILWHKPGFELSWRKKRAKVPEWRKRAGVIYALNPDLSWHIDRQQCNQLRCGSYPKISDSLQRAQFSTGTVTPDFLPHRFASNSVRKRLLRWSPVLAQTSMKSLYRFL